MKKITIITLTLFFTAVTGGLNAHNCHLISAHAQTAETVQLLPGGGERININENYYFTYSFDKKPAVGTMQLTVKIHAADGRQVTPFKVYTDLGMPSMRGAHDELNIEAAVKGNSYITPLRILMRGEWDVVIRIKDSGRDIFAGKISFRV